MKNLIEMVLEDLSTREYFLFRTRCAVCDAHYGNRAVRFSKAGEEPLAGKKQILFDALYEQEYRSARQSAIRDAAEHLNYYIDGYETADIPDMAFISIHTVKKHNRSIYQKLGVASRDELMLYIELFRCCERLDELTHQEPEIE